MSAPDRPAGGQRDRGQRPNYEPTAPQEEFIVPLIKDYVERFLAQLPAPAEGSHALDIGCGRQPFRHVVESRGYSYIGLDVQQNVDATVDVISPIDSDIPRDLIERGPFQLVLVLEVLEHVIDWTTAFQNFATLLAPGGQLLLTCPHVYALHEEPYDFWRPTLYAIDHFARISGLEVVSREAAGDAWSVLGTLLPNFHPRPARLGVLPILAMLAVYLLRRLTFISLRYRVPQRLVQIRGPLYLSNFVVLQRRALEEARER